MKPRVAIVYLSYNSREYIDPVVDSVAALDYPKEAIEFIIVDNDSADDSQAYIREHVVPRSNDDLPQVTFFPEGTNHGFAGGNNLGINHALLEGADYVFLLNNDAKFHPGAISEAVRMAESDASIGAVQALMLLWKTPEIVNSTGGMTHFLGFGYVRDNGRPRADITVPDGTEIAYASGAAVLYRASVLRKVGLLDDFLFLYHEDLELGLRIRLAGFHNVLAKNAVVYHDYAFKRSIKKFFWMERNRFLVLFSHLKWRTLALLAPFLIAVEIALIPLGIHGGWIKEKLFVWFAFLKPGTWKYLRKKRCTSKVLRSISDRELTRPFTGVVTHQENDSWATRIGNPVINGIWHVLKLLIRW